MTRKPFHVEVRYITRTGALTPWKHISAHKSLVSAIAKRDGMRAMALNVAKTFNEPVRKTIRVNVIDSQITCDCYSCEGERMAAYLA